MWLTSLDPEQMDELRRKLEKEYMDYLLYGDGASKRNLPTYGKPLYEDLEEKLQAAHALPIRSGEVDGSE